MHACTYCGTPAQPGLVCCSQYGRALAKARLAIAMAHAAKAQAPNVRMLGNVVVHGYTVDGTPTPRTRPTGPMPYASPVVGSQAPARAPVRSQRPTRTLKRTLNPAKRVRGLQG